MDAATICVVSEKIKTLKIPYVVLIVLGTISFILEIAWLATTVSDPVSSPGASANALALGINGSIVSHAVGIWVGLFMIVTGVLGLVAASKTNNILIYVVLAATALGIVWSITLIGISANVLSFTTPHTFSFADLGQIYFYYFCILYPVAAKTIFALLLLVGIAGLAISIWIIVKLALAIKSTMHSTTPANQGAASIA